MLEITNKSGFPIGIGTVEGSVRAKYAHSLVPQCWYSKHQSLFCWYGAV